MTTVRQIVESTSVEYREGQEHFQYLRAAANDALDGGFPHPVKVSEIKNGINPFDFTTGFLNRLKTWLYPYLHEGPRAFKRRIMVARSPGFGSYFLSAFSAFFMKPSHKFSSDMSDEMIDRFKKKISKGKTLDNFVEDVFKEIKTIGKVCVYTDMKILNPDDNNVNELPSSYIIPFENIRNIAWDGNGEIEFLIWNRPAQIVKVFDSETINEIVAVNKVEFVILREQTARTGNYTIHKNIENNLGKVPAIVKYSNSIVERPGKVDVAYMNIESIINDILTKSGLAIFYAPMGAREKWPKNDDNSNRISSDIIAWVPKDANPPGFAAFPATTVQGHFTLLDQYLNVAFRLSGLKDQSTANVSGLKEQWDFKKTEAVLIDVKPEIVSLVIEIAELWGLYKGQPDLKSIYTIEPFDVLSLMQELQAVQETLRIDLGKTANTIERMKAFNIRNPQADQKLSKKVQTEIEADETKKETAINSPFPDFLNEE